MRQRGGQSHVPPTNTPGGWQTSTHSPLFARRHGRLGLAPQQGPLIGGCPGHNASRAAPGGVALGLARLRLRLSLHRQILVPDKKRPAQGKAGRSEREKHCHARQNGLPQRGKRRGAE
jgi:hypothetical protein